MSLRPNRFALTVLLTLSGCTLDFTPPKSIESTPNSESSQDSDEPPDSKPQDSGKPQDSDEPQDSENPQDTVQDSQTSQIMDRCPDDPNKTAPGICGCGFPDSDQDGDGFLDCVDKCPNDPNKTEPGICGCGSPERDCDSDGTVDCKKECSTETTTTASVPSSSDDAEEAVIGNSSYPTGHVELNSSDLEMTNDVEYHGADQIVGLRFPKLQIPRNALIKEAYVEFVADKTNSESTSLSFSLEAADNAATFSATSFNLSSRSKVASVVAWNNVPTWNAGSKYKTPNLASGLQEVVNRAEWKSGNAVVVLVAGTGIREAVSYDQTPKDAAVLHVTYQ